MKKIVVLSGSPKGDKSITLKYVEWLQQQFTDVELSVHQISQRIRLIESRDAEFQKICEVVREADGVVWAFPVYVFMVPSGYKRFIELISERDALAAFRGKYTIALSTSIHYFDTTAHEYLHAVCDDLGMRFCGSWSAAMDDLLDSQERLQMKHFFERFLSMIDNHAETFRTYAPIESSPFVYEPTKPSAPTDLKGKHVLIITDAENDTNCQRMTQRLQQSFTAGTIITLNLHEIRFKGGCMGCCKCAFDNHCAYGDTDDIRQIYEERYPEADIIIFTGTIRDRYLSALWKRFIERRFMKTHQPLLTGKQFAVLVSGPLSQIPNLRQIFEADVQNGEGNLAGIVTDECADSATLDAAISQLAADVVWMAEANYSSSKMFLAVGGKKVFRDEIYGKLRAIFQADHRYFKSHGFYDFPQKDYKTRFRSWLMMRLFSIPKIRQKVQNELKDQMLKPYLKLPLH